MQRVALLHPVLRPAYRGSVKAALLGLGLSFLCTSDPERVAPGPQMATTSLEAIVLAESAAFEAAACQGRVLEKRYLARKHEDGAPTRYGLAMTELSRRLPRDAGVWRRQREHFIRAGACVEAQWPKGR